MRWKCGKLLIQLYCKYSSPFKCEFFKKWIYDSRSIEHHLANIYFWVGQYHTHHRLCILLSPGELRAGVFFSVLPINSLKEIPNLSHITISHSRKDTAQWVNTRELLTMGIHNGDYSVLPVYNAAQKIYAHCVAYKTSKCVLGLYCQEVPEQGCQLFLLSSSFHVSWQLHRNQGTNIFPITHVARDLSQQQLQRNEFGVFINQTTVSKMFETQSWFCFWTKTGVTLHSYS